MNVSLCIFRSCSCDLQQIYGHVNYEEEFIRRFLYVKYLHVQAEFDATYRIVSAYVILIVMCVCLCLCHCISVLFFFFEISKLCWQWDVVLLYAWVLFSGFHCYKNSISTEIWSGDTFINRWGRSYLCCISVTAQATFIICSISTDASIKCWYLYGSLSLR